MTYTNTLEEKQLKYVDMLISDGRQAVHEARTMPLEVVPEYVGHVQSAERYLAKFLVLFSPATRENAGDWARAAIRGHATMGIAPGADRDTFDAALTAAGVDLERQIWAPGLTDAEASVVYPILGRPAPEPLVDIDQRKAQADAAQLQAMIERAEDPDDW
ncbi:hypothetical protein [Natronoglycomyces albus]|uniref:Uncharacterized protein n=1 Tax=Natronoglycomyces albus TaxID=2811108 RepID=A0A895Y003_9ACTN|nr:hypothetical protein [Natronoglycomyces albus]QSB07148.1 hypothetical protein JQS30_17040 [Natronoglycomyces albus]